MDDITIIVIAVVVSTAAVLAARMYFGNLAAEKRDSWLKERDATLYQRKLDEEKVERTRSREERELTLEERKMEARRQQTAAATQANIERGAAHARGDEIATLGPWVEKLLEDFGVDPDVLFNEEMPPELAQALPFIKGFIQSGGLVKLLGGGESAPPGGAGEGLEI